MDTADEVTLAAHGIVTLDRCITDLNHLENLRLPVHFGTMRFLHHNLRTLAQLWWVNSHGDPVWREEHLGTVVSEAREWLDEHRIRYEELMESKVKA